MKYKIDVLEVDTSKVTVASPTRYKAVVTVMNEGVSEDTFLFDNLASVETAVELAQNFVIKLFMNSHSKQIKK